MAAAAAFHAASVLERLVNAVGPRPAGRVLDLACGRGGLESDPAGADDEEMFGKSGVEGEGVVEGAEVEDVCSGAVGEREAPRLGAGGEEQAVIGQLSVGE